MLLGFADSATVKERRREREDKKEDGEQKQELNEKVAGVVAPRRGRRRPSIPKGSLLKKPQQPRLACLFFPWETSRLPVRICHHWRSFGKHVTKC